MDSRNGINSSSGCVAKRMSMDACVNCAAEVSDNCSATFFVIILCGSNSRVYSKEENNNDMR
jgi:hypothetical protein